MATADLLLELMFSWMEQRERCAEQLKKLAKELESLREKWNTDESVGDFNRGAKAPSSRDAVTKITERFLFSDTLKKTQTIEEQSNKVSDKIQKLFQQLKAEVTDACPSADPDEVDRRIMTQILRAMGRGSGPEGQINVPQFFFVAGPRSMGLNPSSFNPEVVVGILKFFTFEGSGKEFKRLLPKAHELLVPLMSPAGRTTVLRAEDKAVGGAFELAFSLPEAVTKWTEMIEENHVTEASQSLRDTAVDLLKISQTLRDQFDNIRQKLETLDDGRSYIGKNNRRDKQIQPLLNFAKEQSEDEAVKEWLTNSDSDTFSKLVKIFDFLKQEFEEVKKNIDHSEDLHITFVAHGEIRNPLIPASCLVPLPSITDVLLYSPWNCVITPNAAYGVATGRIEPRHMSFSCKRKKGCKIPNEGHQPANLPDRWNSMRSAAQQMIPNIFVTTLKKPADGAWKQTLVLNDEHGQPRRNRIVVPFILPGAMVSSVTVPFSVVTLALSLVLFFSGYKATVHLVACLGRSAGTTLNEADLKEQYACTVDNTAMTASEDMLVHRDSELFRAFEAVFG